MAIETLVKRLPPGQAVQLKYPQGRFVVRPGSFKPGTPARAVVRGMGFDAIEAA